MADIEVDPMALRARAARLSAVADELVGAAAEAHRAGVARVGRDFGGEWAGFADALLTGLAGEAGELIQAAVELRREADALTGAEHAATERMSAIRRFLG